MAALGIIDYQCGNLFNLVKALKYVGASNCEIVTDTSRIDQFDKLVLPGVGSFNKGMQNILGAGFDHAIRKHVSGGKPLLGVCVGMQLLMSSSEEFGITKGLGLIEGNVLSLRRIAGDPATLVPNIGWCEVVRRDCGIDSRVNAPQPSRLFAGVIPDPLCYFAHSYALQSLPENVKCWTTRFNEGYFVSAVEKDYLFGVQFHPELSGDIGLAILKNYLEI